MTEAHEGMVPDPSRTGACDVCHPEIAGMAATSLHSNLWGYKELVEHRTGAEYASFEEPFGDSCNGCHTTCGQCHVSRPVSVGGGLVKSHKFAPPHMTNQCTACHGSRISVDYFGETGAFGDGGGLPGNLKDVHWSNLMQCTACHEQDEMHGDSGGASQPEGHYTHRYQTESMPRCDSAVCHASDIASGQYHLHHNGVDADCHACHTGTGADPSLGCGVCHPSGVPVFTSPLPTLQCNVCHSQPYKNCQSCHSNGIGGGYDDEAITSEGLLKIAKNPRTDYRPEYDYVLVRHVPADEQTYSQWGLSATFESGDQPTWKYTSPHNILLNTDQTTVESGQSCGASCHGSEYYLRAADIVGEYDEDVNSPFVIPEEK